MVRACLLSTLFASLFAVPASAGVVRLSSGGVGPGLSWSYGDVERAPDGTLYAVDTGANAVEKLTADGKPIKEWGTNGSGPGQFNEPHGVAVAPDGTIWVTDPQNNRVQHFDADGAYLDEIGTAGPPEARLNGPRGIAIDAAGTIYVGDCVNSRVVRFSSTGTYLGHWGSQGTGDGQFSGGSVYGGPWSIEIHDGVVYVLDQGGQLNRVQRFTPDGSFLGAFGSKGTGSGQFDYAWDIHVGAGGVVIPDSKARISRFELDGRFRDVFALPGVGVPQLRGIAGEDETYWISRTDGLIRVDPSPQAAIKPPQLPGLTTAPVPWDASESIAPFRALTFTWDLDGDGSFETDTGASTIAARAYSTAGRKTARVKATSSDGRSSVAEASHDVRPLPPTGPIGVSINEGAVFTNTPDVTLLVRWPIFEAEAVISNDGGFAAAARLPLAAAMRWKLAESGPERLPKTVYVRFGNGTQTFQDDIILDQTDPAITRARATGTRVLLKARDATSGVAEMQISASKARPGKWVRFRSAAKFPLRKGKKAHIRVRDRAGNRSKWKSVRRR